MTIARPGQFTLGKLIKLLQIEDPTAHLRYDFVHFKPTLGIHSYRGYYEDLAVGYGTDDNITVGELTAKLKEAVGRTYQGWKGGEYRMDTDTPVWVSNPSEAGGTAIVGVRDDGWVVTLLTASVD